MLAISPDGTHVVTPVQDGAVSRLWVRPLARLEGATLAHTDGALYPFWSADGHAVGFFADGKLKTVDLSGASPQTIADVQEGYGGTWNKAGVILYARQFDAIYRVAENGRAAVPVTELDATRGDIFHRYPRFLPDGVHFLFLIRSSNSDANGIYVASLASKETHKLVDALTKPEFAPPDLLLFARESTLMGQRLDTSSFRAIGAPFRVVEPMSSNTTSGSAAFSVSDNDVLAYRAGVGGDVRDMAWVDRNGTRGVTLGATAGYQNPRLSPDGKKLAVFKPENGGDIWVTDLERGGISARFTLDPANDNTPLWSRDGTRIAFVSNRNGGIFNIYQKNAGGTGPEELLLKTPRHKQLNDWSRDDQYLVYEEDDPQTKTDLWVLPLSGARKPSRLLATPFNESEATLSPNSHWMAYTSDESGARQVYVQKFPTSDRKWPVSSGRVGTHARWSPQGDELFFDGGGIMYAVSVTGLESGSEFRLGPPKRLFDGLLALAPHNFDVLDAGRFLVMLAPETGTGTAPITIVMNWQSGLSLAR
jgi:Tol biopolymer transport system component